MPRHIHHDRMVLLFRRALAHGARRLSPSSAEWSCHGDCQDPWRTEVIGRPVDEGEKYVLIDPSKRMTLFLVITTRCRRCAPCRNARRREWAYRVRQETRSAVRTWFGTLTMSPESQYLAVVAARKSARDRSVPWGELSEEQRFRRVADASLKEVTKYIKRVRKQSKAPLRYLVVTEKHKSGNPHFHMLVHELSLVAVKHSVLSSQWKLGFERWRLVPPDQPEQARYLCKYLTKSAETRIRASFSYGSGNSSPEGALIAGSLDVLRRNENEEGSTFSR